MSSASSGSESDSSLDSNYGRKVKGAAKKKARRAGKAAEGPAEAADAGDLTLFETVRKGQSKVVRDAAKAWVASYKDNADEAMITILNFIFESCGAKSEFIPEGTSLGDVDVAKHAKTVIASMASCAADGYPLVDKSKGAGKFSGFFRLFWERVVAVAHEEGILVTPDSPIPTVLGWLTTISSADIRAMRHTAVVAVCAAGGSVLTVLEGLEKAKATAEKQLPPSAGKARKGVAAHAVDSAQQSIVSLCSLIEELFNGVLVHRFRDVFGPIRAVVTQALGAWTLSYPAMFLPEGPSGEGASRPSGSGAGRREDLERKNYMKYIAWLLSDREAVVRSASLNALLPLLQSKELAPRLQKTVEKFRDRLLQMTEDVDKDVAILAYSVLSALSETQYLDGVDLLGPEFGVFHEEATIRGAAAEFLIQHASASAVPLQLGSFLALVRRHLLSVTEDEVLEVSAEDGGEFLRGFEIISYGSAVCECVVDAFWGRGPAGDLLKDWPAAIELLANDEATTHVDEPDQFLLLSLLSGAVRRAAGYNSMDPKAAPFKEPSETSEDITSLTRAIASQLPTLFQKFRSDAQKVYHLVVITQFLDLNVFDGPSQSKNCTAIIRGLWDLYTTLPLEALLEATAAAIGRFARHEFSRSRDVEAELKKLLPPLAKRAGSPKGEEVDILLSLLRLKYLCMSLDVASVCEDLKPRGSITTALVSFVRSRSSSDGSVEGYNPNSVTSALDSLFHLFLWCFAAIQKIAARVGVAPSGGEAADGEAVATLRASVSALVPFRDTVLDGLVGVLSVADAQECSPEFSSVVRPFVIARLGDLGVMTTKRMVDTYLEPLCVELEPKTAEYMARCVDEALIHTEVEPSKKGAAASASMLDEEKKALSDFNLLGIVLSSVRCVAFGFGFTELVLPMLADMEVPAAATAVKLLIKEMKPTRAEDIFNMVLDGLWRLYKLLGSPDGVCKIAKKLRPLLISREAKGAKKSGVALFRMLQMGFMEALKNVKEDSGFLKVLQVFLEFVPKGNGRVMGKFLQDRLDKALTDTEKTRLRKLQLQFGSAKLDAEPGEEWMVDIIAFETAATTV